MAKVTESPIASPSGKRVGCDLREPGKKAMEQQYMGSCCTGSAPSFPLEFKFLMDRLYIWLVLSCTLSTYDNACHVIGTCKDLPK